MKLIRILLTLSVVLFICSCSDDDLGNKDNERVEIGMVDHHNSPAWCSHHGDVETRQLTNVNGPGWSPCEASSLTIFIPECLNGVWNTAINNAVGNFNDVPGTSVNFEVVETAGEADMVIHCYDNEDGCDGGFVDESFVNSGMSSNINFNASLDLGNCEENFLGFGGCPGGLDVCSATHIAMHEMFHALGFFHNNSNHGNSVQVAGTPNSDPNSIINGGNIIDWCELPCEFSEFDIIALQEIYPADDACDCPQPPCECNPDACECRYSEEVTLTGPEYICEGESATFCVSAIGSGGSHYVHWKTKKGISTGGTCREYNFPGPGTYTITAEACEDGCCWDVSKTVTVGGCKCYCECEIEDNWGDYTEIYEYEIDCDSEERCGDASDREECRFVVRPDPKPDPEPDPDPDPNPQDPDCICRCTIPGAGVFSYDIRCNQDCLPPPDGGHCEKIYK